MVGRGRGRERVGSGGGDAPQGAQRAGVAVANETGLEGRALRSSEKPARQSPGRDLA